MKIVVGLGNPGKDYARTRHNIGFMVLDHLRRHLSNASERSRFRSQIVEGSRDGEKVVLVAPQTFMNLSGHAVREARSWFHADTDDIIVVYDDMDLPFGSLRLRGNGSAGGHNGMSSIVEQLGTADVPRLKVGIGRPRSGAVGHVLSRFGPDEEKALPDVIQKAAGAILMWMDDGLIVAMNEVNRKPDKPKSVKSDAVAGQPTAEPAEEGTQ
jgi:peptidyl-tRNA hydrolase, PTH1 family